MHLTIDTLDAGGYRKFGLTTGAIVLILFGLLIPWLFGLGFPKWPWVLAGLLAAWALLAPTTLRPVYTGWMKFGHAIGWFNTRLILGLVFFVIFFPVALVLKLLRKDPIARKLDDTAGSYRVASKQPPREQLERPY